MGGRGRLVAGIVAIAVAGGLAWWWLRDGGGPDGGRAGVGTSPAKLGAARITARGPGGALRWLGQVGLAPGRIAGRVTYAGSPVAGATVRLELSDGLHRAVPPLIAVTGPAGQFDFGLQPPTALIVVASAPGRAPGGVAIDLRDPTLTPSPDRLELALGACDRTVSGIVHDDGGPVAGATVRVATAWHLRFGHGRLNWTAVDESGGDGRYQLCLRPGQELMTVEADGYASVSVELVGEEHVRRDVELAPEAVISGVVLGNDGQPGVGALVIGRVVDYTASHTDDTTAVSGPDGRFSIGGMVPGRYALRAIDAGAATAEEVEVFARVGGGGEQVTLRMAPTLTTRGRVLAGDRPVPGARLSSTPAGTEVPFVASDVVTDRDGRFVLSGLQPGPRELRVWGHDILEPALLVAAFDAPEVVVRVVPRARVRGRVLRDGAPVANAIVYANGPGYVGSSLADAAGRYQLVGLGAGTYELGARDGSASARPLPLTVANGQVVDAMDIALEVTGSIAGIVVDQGGEPVAGAVVRFGEHKRRALFAPSTTGTDGSFVVRGLPPGDYVASVTAGVASPVALRPGTGTRFAPVTLTEERSHAEGVRLAVEVGTLQIAGSVVFTAGERAADAVVSALAIDGEAVSNDLRSTSPVSRTRTAADGSFTLRDLPPGRYALMAVGPKGEEGVEKDVAAGGTGVRIALPATGGIEGTLVGFGDATAVSARPAAYLDRYRTTATGTRFTLRDLPPGPYAVEARDGARRADAFIIVEPGATATATLTNPGTATVTGRATLRDTGAPVSGAACGAGGYPPVLTDADGRFSISIPAQRRVGLSCRAGEVRSSPVRVQLEPGATTDVILQLVNRKPM
jgi:hypothetical protein